MFVKEAAMKIGVSGANGKLGRSTIANLIARDGHEVVAISRTPDAISTAAVTARFGDYDDPASLAGAYAGLDSLLIIPSADLRPDIRGPQFIRAIDAAVAARVGPIVLVSAQGTRKVMTPSMANDYWIGEQHLIANAPNWTILRPCFHAEAMAQEAQLSAAHGVLTGLGEESVAYVSRDDLAAAAAAVLTGEGHDGAIYQISGPERLTGREKAGHLSAVLGREISFLVMDEAALRDGLNQAGIPATFVDAIIEGKREAASHNYDYLSGDVERLTGRKPRNLSAVLAEALIAEAA
jgi:NAD(P)H dehydrogenase (quinone)